MLSNINLMQLFEDYQNPDFDFEAQLETLLTTAKDNLELDIAIISHIKAKTYVVEHCAGGGLERGAEFKLGHTYCSITVRNQDLVAIHHMAISEYFRHPCYEAFQLESYIGAPIYKSGQLYGTVNFSAGGQRAISFTEEEQAFVKHVSETVSWVLDNRPHTVTA